MRYTEFIKKLQSEMNAQGESLKVDGVPGPKTQSALLNFDAQIIISKIPDIQPAPPAQNEGTHLSPIDWMRGEIGQKEIFGSKDNPRIRWYHTHCANIGSKEHPDEVPWCSSILNACADETGMEKTDNALASSWQKYGLDSGDQVEEGDIIVIRRSDGGRHVGLANERFKISSGGTFEMLGGNQSNACNVSRYQVSNIVAARKWVAKKGTKSAPITTGQDPDEGTEPWYRRMFDACEISPGKEAQVAKSLKLVESGMDRYRTVAKAILHPNMKTNVVENFSRILGCIHFKEASCDFRGVLHNGEKIVGTHSKTSIVPKGRGPFATWEESAIDAINMSPSRWSALLSGSIEIGKILFALERYNGTGYITGAGRAETSPYLWACSNINDGRGKYVADGKFDPNASTGSTAGAALLLKEMARKGSFNIF